MPNKINILSDSMMKRIAAGEVVERPASAAKELLENAIDAGADEITLIIKGAGMDLIQVVDNGAGMTEEDALICCHRHATSKILNPDDLEEIHTLGFRGEALASISSVSRMILVTRTENDEEATRVDLVYGEIGEVEKTAAKKGTSVSVRDLFSNVPARRKFLKQPPTELRHLIGVFRRMALAYPGIDFSLYINDEKTLDLRKATSWARLRDLIGVDKAHCLIPVSGEFSGITVTGYVSRPGEGRRTREDQFLFLNQRYIISRSLSHAILSAYGQRLASNEYPMFFLFLSLNPRQVDVNVHPTKIEVRFFDEKFVHDMVNRAVKNAFSQPETVPDLHLVPKGIRKQQDFHPFKSTPEDQGQLTLEAQRPAYGNAAVAFHDENREKPALWQIHNRYILSQIKSGMTIIDQHIAHERILYERALKSRTARESTSQQLLFPQTVQLQPSDYIILRDMIPALRKIGFDIKDFGKNTVVIEAVPVEVKTGSERELLQEIIDAYKEEQDTAGDIFNAVAKSFACKSAVKSGEQLSFQEMASLVDRLFACSEPYFCPHGRPIVVNLSLKEIDKRFGR